jgi:nucleoid DNA-binding protein
VRVNECFAARIPLTLALSREGRGERISVKAFNAFVLVLVKRRARMGRNPQIGKAIKILAKTVVRMRMAKAAKEAIVPRRKYGG